MKAKFAKFECDGRNPLFFEYVEDGLTNDGFGDWVRTTEFVEVDLPTRAPDAVVQQQLEVLERTEREVENDYERKIKVIRQRRAELAALTYQSQEYVA